MGHETSQRKGMRVLESYVHGNRACVVRGGAVGNVLQSNALAAYSTLFVNYLDFLLFSRLPYIVDMSLTNLS